MNALRQVDNNGKYSPDCSWNHAEMSEIKDNLNTLTQSIQVLTTYYREMTRWLLIVVCVIALGKETLSLAKSLWTQNASAEQAEK